ncbi:hypothetical protein SDC9_104730 [bioreactor metagenome]|uniref:Uncharacterized protein n=1 Tax=bioreactor metagenome TaxID=1076179 RepID=A0A645B014_9ZZZZ
MKAKPVEAPSSVTLLIITITSITSSAGIATFVNFSIPLEIPPITMSTVKAINIPWNKMFCPPLIIKLPKNAPLPNPPKPAPSLNSSIKNPSAYLSVYPPRTL